MRSAFRRGRTEVTVDVDLGDGVRRVVALGAPPAGPRTADTPTRPDDAAHHALAPAPGARVRVALDPSGCAVVPAGS